jgi:hypothetical protein
VPKKGRTVGDEPKVLNAKDVVGSDKVPMHLWPTSATVLGALALLDGMLKYGKMNYRAAPHLRVSIYLDALMRHTAAYVEGEDIDPDSGIPHLGHALACIAILIDAGAADNLLDDRPLPGGYRAHLDKHTADVPRLKAKHAHRTPRHWTIADRDNAVREEDPLPEVDDMKVAGLVAPGYGSMNPDGERDPQLHLSDDEFAFQCRQNCRRWSCCDGRCALLLAQKASGKRP